MFAFDDSGLADWEILAKNNAYETIQDNRRAEFDKLIPSQQPSQSSWFDARNLEARIKSRIEVGKNWLNIRDYVENLPSLFTIDELCEKVALQLGLSIAVENISSDPSYELELLISWE